MNAEDLKRLEDIKHRLTWAAYITSERDSIIWLIARLEAAERRAEALEKRLRHRDRRVLPLVNNARFHMKMHRAWVKQWFKATQERDALEAECRRLRDLLREWLEDLEATPAGEMVQWEHCSCLPAAPDSLASQCIACKTRAALTPPESPALRSFTGRGFRAVPRDYADPGLTPPEAQGRELAGHWPGDDLRRAFVAGTKWWEFESTKGTMWPSDCDKAEAEAERRYPGGKAERRATEQGGAGEGTNG